MERQKILDELAEIQRRIAEYLEILGSDKVLRDLIVKELKEVQKEYGDERRTADHRGHRRDPPGRPGGRGRRGRHRHARRLPEAHLRRYLPAADARRQGPHRHGHAHRGFRRAPDRRLHARYLLIFTTRGRVYWLKVYEIPDATTTGKGKHISNLINLQPDETVKAFLAVKDFVPDQFIVMVTKHGVIKKSELTEFDNPMSRGIIAVSLDEGDELIGAKITNGEQLHLPGLARRAGHPLRRKPGARHGPPGARRARHGPGRGRLPGGHGSGGEGGPHPLHRRKRLRQAHAARRTTA